MHPQIGFHYLKHFHATHLGTGECTKLRKIIVIIQITCNLKILNKQSLTEKPWYKLFIFISLS